MPIETCTHLEHLLRQHTNIMPIHDACINQLPIYDSPRSIPKTIFNIANDTESSVNRRNLDMIKGISNKVQANSKTNNLFTYLNNDDFLEKNA